MSGLKKKKVGMFLMFNSKLWEIDSHIHKAMFMTSGILNPYF